jgi:hypothetical protein
VTTAKPIIRCSSLPILAKCFGQLGATLTVDVESDIAEAGTNHHGYAARMIREGRAPDMPTLDPDAAFIRARIRMAWDAIKADFPDPQVEKQLVQVLPNFTLCGHPDLYGVKDGILRVPDWKSGYNTDADVLPQLLGYAYLAHCEIPKDTPISKIELSVVWLRDKTIQEWEFTPAQVKEWMRDLHKRAGAWNGNDFTAGEHCQYCPRFHDCPARQALARSAVQDIMDLDVATATRMDMCKRLPDVYSRVQMVQRQVDAFRDWLRGEIQKNGPMVCGPEKILRLQTRNKSVLDVQKGWSVFRAVLSDDELSKCMTVSKTKLLAAVGEKSAPRMKARDQKAMMEKLQEVGAVTVKAEQALQWVKSIDEEEEIK